MRSQLGDFNNKKKKNDPEDINKSFYANGRFRQVISCNTHIKTAKPDPNDDYLVLTHRIKPFRSHFDDE